MFHVEHTTNAVEELQLLTNQVMALIREQQDMIRAQDDHIKDLTAELQRAMEIIQEQRSLHRNQSRR
jgi:hypothetical protein